MREIKFRVWDYDTVSMNYGADLHWNNRDKCYHIRRTSAYQTDLVRTLNHFELMQFTGLFDKKGKEIYEGDIVSEAGWNWKVNFRNGCFMADRVYVQCADAIAIKEGIPLAHNHGEIIGNIYQNPELIK